MFYTGEMNVMAECQGASIHYSSPMPLPFTPLRSREIRMTNSEITQNILNEKIGDKVFITEFTGFTDKQCYKIIQGGAFLKPIKMG